jgi:hypothetical protein
MNPFENSTLDSHEIQSIGTTIELLELKLNLKDEYFEDPDVDFGIFKHYHHYSTTISYPIEKNCKYNGYINFAEVIIRERGKYGHTDYHNVQMWGVSALKKCFPQVVIRPEGIIDKFHEFIEPVELDFSDDPEFSKRFYVLTDKKESTIDLLTQDYREAIKHLHLKEFFLEFNKNWLVIGTRKMIDGPTTLELLDFLIRIKKIQEK